MGTPMQYTFLKDDQNHLHVVVRAKDVVELLVRRFAKDTLLPLFRVEDVEGCKEGG
jgi:hypothetical protein